MEFVEDGKLVERDQDEKSKNCSHEIETKLIEGSNTPYCKHCGMVAHEDGDFVSYGCGMWYCKCSS